MNGIMRKNKSIVRWFYVNMGLIFIMAAFLGEMNMAQSELIVNEIFSPSLAGNLLGDPATRPMSIYLPPNYNVGDKRYPVVYLLHGYSRDHMMWSDLGWIAQPIDTVMDDLIQQGQAQEMILVMLHASNKYLGSWYVNSSVSGNYEDYITQDLVRFVDGKYRTLPQRESRAVAGASMGGFGAMYLAMKYPEVYCAVVSESGPLSSGWFRSFLGLVKVVPIAQGMAMAFSPNPDSPLLYDDPTNDDVWKRWLEHIPANMVSTHQENLKRLAGIYFDHGMEDTSVPVSSSRELDKALTEAGIPHVYEEYHGGHFDNLDRVRTRLEIGLTFLSNLLSSNTLTTTPVQPKNKLAATWGEIRNSN